MIPSVSGKARPWVAGAIAGLAVGLLGLLVAATRPAAFERGELWTYDLRLRRSAAARHAATNIVLVHVSEQDITDVENNLSMTWPWPRAMFGYLATYCKNAGARAVVFDWMFQDRGQFSVADAEDFAGALRDAGNAVIGLALTRDPLVRSSSGGPWALPVMVLPTRKEAVSRALALQAWNARTFLLNKGGGQTELWIGGAATAADVLTTWGRLAQEDTALDLLTPPPPTDAATPTDATTPCLLYTSPSPRDGLLSRMPSSA